MLVREYKDSDPTSCARFTKPRIRITRYRNLSQSLFVTKKVWRRRRHRTAQRFCASPRKAYLLRDRDRQADAKRWQWLLALHDAAERGRLARGRRQSSGCRRLSQEIGKRYSATGWTRPPPLGSRTVRTTARSVSAKSPDRFFFQSHCSEGSHMGRATSTTQQTPDPQPPAERAEPSTARQPAAAGHFPFASPPLSKHRSNPGVKTATKPPSQQQSQGQPIGSAFVALPRHRRPIERRTRNSADSPI